MRWRNAFTLQSGYRSIGVGAWLGTIMLLNVWVFIWPNQKKILGIVPATDEEKAAARKVGGPRVAHQFHSVDSHADVHGRPGARTAVLADLGGGAIAPAPPACAPA